MGEITERMRREATEKAHIPVTPGVTDLPSVEAEGEVERMAQHVREQARQVHATLQAIKERLTVEHVRRVASFRAREAIARPGTRRRGITILSGVGLAFAALKAALYVRSRGKRKEH